MKKILIAMTAGAALLSLAACGSSSSKTTKSSSQSPKTVAKADAQTVLDFMYDGNSSGLSDVSKDSASEIKKNIVDKLEEKQTTSLLANGNKNDFYLVVDGSKYTADEIISSYADAYYKQVSTIGEAKIESVSLTGDTAKVKATIKPIAGLSEANPIGSARTSLFGGIDNDTIIRQSGNKDVKTIQKLITLDLYGMYYGQMGKVAEKSDKTTTISFNMKKSGSHFVVDEDTLVQLVKDSRSNDYAPSSSSSSTGSSSSSTETSKDQASTNA